MGRTACTEPQCLYKGALYFYLTELAGRRGIRVKQLLDDLEEKRGYCKLKAKAVDFSLWETHSRRIRGPVLRQTKELMIVILDRNV
jgi:hypothetical protein